MGKQATRLRKAVEKYLAARGWIVIPLGCISRPIGDRWVKVGTPGAPDLLCHKLVVRNERGEQQFNLWRVVAVELKATKGERVSSSQIKWRREHEQGGIFYEIVRDVSDLTRAGI